LRASLTLSLLIVISCGKLEVKNRKKNLSRKYWFRCHLNTKKIIIVGLEKNVFLKN
jgi:hypothetical protein